jgi:hypothetical protein
MINLCQYILIYRHKFIIDILFIDDHYDMKTAISSLIPYRFVTDTRGGSRIFRTLVKNFVAEHWGRGYF